MAEAAEAAPSKQQTRFSLGGGGALILTPGSREWAWAETVWEFHRMRMDVAARAATVHGTLVLCSHDLRVADRAAELFKAGQGGKWCLFSGGMGTGSHSGQNLNGWTRPEAEIFAERALQLGVPPEAVHTEARSKNTGENIRFSREILEERNLTHANLLVVQKPFMERRSLATLLKQWGALPLPRITVTSPEVSFADYPDGHISREAVVNIMVGDLQRLRVYATEERPYQVPVEVPGDVWEAYQQLVAAGFDANVIRDADGALIS